MLQGPFLYFRDELSEAWGGEIPCPKSHSKWKSWHGTSSRFEVQLFLLTIQPSLYPQGYTQLWESRFKKVTWETHHQAAWESLPVQHSFHCKFPAEWYGSPWPVHPPLVRAHPELCLRRRVGERMQILKILYEEFKEAPLVWQFVFFDYRVNWFGILYTGKPMC